MSRKRTKIVALGPHDEWVQFKIFKPAASCSSDKIYNAMMHEKDLKAFIRVFKKMAKHIKKEGDYFENK